MKTVPWIFVFVVLLNVGKAADGLAPFVVSIAPTKVSAFFRNVEGAGKNERGPMAPLPFHVVLTNQAKEAQPIFESWNSWGYRNLYFEIAFADGKKSTVTVRPRGFDKNFPSTFLIAPGEHQVFPITIDDRWEQEPKTVKFGDQEATIKAVYEVKETPEGAKAKVWVGRVESKSYPFKLVGSVW